MDWADQIHGESSLKYIELQGNGTSIKVPLSSITRLEVDRSGKYVYLMDGKRFQIDDSLYDLIDKELFVNSNCLNPLPSES